MNFRSWPLISLFLLASCQYNSEQKAEQEAQKLKKTNATALNIQLGMSYLKQGDMPRAKKKLLTALELSPNDTEANGAMAYFLEKTGEFEKAKIYYVKALSKATNRGAALNNYGAFLCRQGQYKEAENYFLKAVQDVQYVHSAAAYENAGLCVSAIPDYQKAKSYFIKALEQDPNRKQALYELTSIELKQNEAKSALSHIEQYKSVALNDPTLLAMALTAAHQAGKADLEAAYRLQLSQLNYPTDDFSGENNEHNSNNG